MSHKREDLSQVNPQLYKWLAIINNKSSTYSIVSKKVSVVNTYNVKNVTWGHYFCHIQALKYPLTTRSLPHRSFITATLSKLSRISAETASPWSKPISKNIFVLWINKYYFKMEYWKSGWYKLYVWRMSISKIA